MRWNLPLFVLLLAAGPAVYLALDALQPDRLAVFGLLVVLPLGWIITRGVWAALALLFGR